MVIGINTTGIHTLIIYLHDKTMTTADYSGREGSKGSQIKKTNFHFYQGLYGGTFLYKPTYWDPNKNGTSFTGIQPCGEIFGLPF